MNEYSNIEFLLQQLIHGSEDAWSYFLRQYDGLIYHCINKILNVHTPKEDKEDCFQEILNALIEDNYRRLRQIHSFEEKAFRSWLGSVTHHRTLNFLRRKSKVFPIPEEILEVQPDTSTIQDTETLKRQIMDFINDLLPEKERLVMMFFLDGLTLNEISMIMGINFRRVSKIKQNAISELKILLERDEKVLE